MAFKKDSHASSLFLLEIVISIVVFAAASAVCLNLFLHAKNLSVGSYDTNCAVSAASSAAELIRSCNSFEEFESALMEIYPSAKNEGSINYVVYLDESLKDTAASDSSYVMHVSVNQEEAPAFFRIIVYKSINTSLDTNPAIAFDDMAYASLYELSLKHTFCEQEVRS